MPGVKVARSRGALRDGWQATTDDYAIAGAWSADGALLLVGDAAGNVYGFDGTSGKLRWIQRGAHPGGVMAAAMDPAGVRFATAGQDGHVAIWHAVDGGCHQRLEVADRWAEHVAWSTDGTHLAVAAGKVVRIWTRDGAPRWSSEPRC